MKSGGLVCAAKDKVAAALVRSGLGVKRLVSDSVGRTTLLGAACAFFVGC